MDAVLRASQMMKIPMRELPKLAIDYAQFLCNKHGMCGEVLLSAFAHYAQYVESLSCEDSLYIIDDEGKAWFTSSKSLNLTNREV